MSVSRDWLRLKMTEAQAWREVARRFAEGKNIKNCLCDEYANVVDGFWCLTPHIELFDPDGHHDMEVFWPIHGNREERILAACFLAAIAEVGE